MSTTFEYAPAPESRDVPGLREIYSQFIDGGFAEPAGGDLTPIVEPASGREIARVADGDVDAAVRSARAALPGWAALDGRHRARRLFRFARLVSEHARELAVLQT